MPLLDFELSDRPFSNSSSALVRQACCPPKLGGQRERVFCGRARGGGSKAASRWRAPPRLVSDRVMKPGPCQIPIAANGALRYLEHGSDFLLRQPAEKLQLH